MDDMEFIEGREIDAEQADRLFQRDLLKVMMVPEGLITETEYSNYAVAVEHHRSWLSDFEKAWRAQFQGVR